MKDCNSTADIDYCCMGGIDPIIITDDDIKPDVEEPDLDQYDVESLIGVGSTILVLGGLIMLVASKQNKKQSDSDGDGDGDGDGDSEGDSEDEGERGSVNGHDRYGGSGSRDVERLRAALLKNSSQV